MGNTYTKIYIHAVTAVKYRQALIHPSFKEELYRYMAGIIKEADQIPIMINGVADHVHLLFAIKPAFSISDLMRLVKTNSSKWINDRKFLPRKFNWQRGFGAFSCGYSQVEMVRRYIINQEQHHAKHSFKEEYIGLLESNLVEYDKEYLFDWILED